MEGGRGVGEEGARGRGKGFGSRNAFFFFFLLTSLGKNFLGRGPGLNQPVRFQVLIHIGLLSACLFNKQVGGNPFEFLGLVSAGSPFPPLP